MKTELKEPAIAYGQPNTLEGFLEFSETSELRYEFWNGDLFAMSNTSKDHADITFNLHTEIKKKLKNSACKSFQESIFLRIEKTNNLFLPDIIVTSDKRDFDRESRFLDFPTLIIEILSDSTEINDRTYKWQQYRKIPTLKHYLLVSQKQPLIEMFSRPNPLSLFYYQTFEGIDTMVELREMEIAIPMRNIYEGIIFDETNLKNPIE